MADAAAGAAAAGGSKDATKIVLFDVDGTLTEARKAATPEVLEFLSTLRERVYIGMVGGSDLVKQKEQLGDGVVDMFDYCFPENGLAAYYEGKVIGTTSFKEYVGEDNIKLLVNFILGYLAGVDIPVKRGTFIEFRNGMLNVSPIGRNCSRSERNDFEAFDKEHHIRRDMVAALRERFKDAPVLKDLQYSIGGQISFDVFPRGWDKTYCLRYLEGKGFEEIHFFGDKTFEGGNDFEIFSDERTVGHTVTRPQDTMEECRRLFLS